MSPPPCHSWGLGLPPRLRVPLGTNPLCEDTCGCTVTAITLSPHRQPLCPLRQVRKPRTSRLHCGVASFTPGQGHTRPASVPSTTCSEPRGAGCPRAAGLLSAPALVPGSCWAGASPQVGCPGVPSPTALLTPPPPHTRGVASYHLTHTPECSMIRTGALRGPLVWLPTLPYPSGGTKRKSFFLSKLCFLIWEMGAQSGFGGSDELKR